MLISDNNPYLRFYTSNSISTPYIEYQTIPKTTNKADSFVDFDGWNSDDGGAPANTYTLGGLNFEIREHTFVTTYTPSYNDDVNSLALDPYIGTSLYNINSDYTVPFIYLKVPIGDLPSGESAVSSRYIRAASSFHSIYINATATFVSNSVGITDSNDNNILGHGIMFEHYGTRTPFLGSDIDDGTYDQRNSSEFIVLGKLNKRAYYPTIPTAQSNVLTQPYEVTANTNTVDNAIRWNSEDNSFECQLLYNDIINFSSVNPITAPVGGLTPTPPGS